MPIFVQFPPLTVSQNVSADGYIGSYQVLDVFLGQPTGHMLIFTGIAYTSPVGYITDSTEAGIVYDVIVKLGRSATTIAGYTAVVGLAGIGNLASEFLFGTTDTSVDLDDQGELQLHATLQVFGKGSLVSQFSF